MSLRQRKKIQEVLWRGDSAGAGRQAPVRQLHRVLRRLGRRHDSGLRDEAGRALPLPRRGLLHDLRAPAAGAVPTRWRNRPAFILKSAGRDPDEGLLEWMRSFSADTGSPFFYEQKGERFGFGPTEFQQEMLVKLESGERLW